MVNEPIAIAFEITASENTWGMTLRKTRFYTTVARHLSEPPK